MPQTESNTYRIIALDDHPMVIEGISHILATLDGVSHQGTTNAKEMMALLTRGQCFDLFILDLELPDADGFEAIKRIREKCPDAGILIYTMHEEPWIIARLASLDIQGVVSKSRPVSRLLEAIRAIREGDTFFDGHFMQLLSHYAADNDQVASGASPAFTLSDREQEVLRCIARGLTTEQIAATLYISKNTVGTYRRRLMTKFGAHNVAQLIGKARAYIDN